MNPVEQASSPRSGRRAIRGAARVAGLLAAAAALGALSREITASEARRTEPAGFVAGILHGAAMPCALPSLALGSDPALYASLNTGRGYKLGYTVGVNACGAVFFGLLYRRLARRGRTDRGDAGDRA